MPDVIQVTFSLSPEVALANWMNQNSGNGFVACHSIIYYLLTSPVGSYLGNLRPRPLCIDIAIAWSIHQGRGLRFPWYEQTGEVNKLFIIWPFHCGPEPKIN